MAGGVILLRRKTTAFPHCLEGRSPRRVNFLSTDLISSSKLCNVQVKQWILYVGYECRLGPVLPLGLMM
jgi:hypothetical protein